MVNQHRYIRSGLLEGWFILYGESSPTFVPSFPLGQANISPSQLQFSGSWFLNTGEDFLDYSICWDIENITTNGNYHFCESAYSSGDIYSGIQTYIPVDLYPFELGNYEYTAYMYNNETLTAYASSSVATFSIPRSTLAK